MIELGHLILLNYFNSIDILTLIKHISFLKKHQYIHQTSRQIGVPIYNRDS
jgi:hypothetical protein